MGPDERTEYIDETAAFVDWLLEYNSELTTELPSLHEWIGSQNWHLGPYRKIKWHCSSLFDAHTKYYWKASNSSSGDFTATCKLLESLAYELTSSIESGSNSDCKKICDQILLWGGVNNKPSIATNLRDAAKKNLLKEYLINSSRLLASEMKIVSGESTIEVGNENIDIQIDSGTTKIFSLLVEDFIIYDSRVGAALDFLAVKWAVSQGHDDIPESLRFGWSSPTRNRRNPNQIIPQNFKRPNAFPRMPKGKTRLAMNIKASWICNEIARKSLAKDSSVDFANIPTHQRSRAIESALFMIGYAIA